MKTKVLHADGETTYALILHKGDEVVAELTAFARQRGLTAGHLTAIGAFSDVTLGYFDRTRKDYVRIVIEEQVEVLSLLGDIASDKGQPKLHAHVVIGTSNGTAHGGHLLEAHVWPTLEVILVEPPAHLWRRMDPESGLALIDLDAAVEHPTAADRRV
jgi:predicted DNA-binding protein with PD1-like motif